MIGHLLGSFVADGDIEVAARWQDGQLCMRQNGHEKSRLFYEKNKRLDSVGTICSFQILLTREHIDLIATKCTASLRSNFLFCPYFFCDFLVDINIIFWCDFESSEKSIWYCPCKTSCVGSAINLNS